VTNDGETDKKEMRPTTSIFSIHEVFSAQGKKKNYSVLYVFGRVRGSLFYIAVYVVKCRSIGHTQHIKRKSKIQKETHIETHAYEKRPTTHFL